MYNPFKPLEHITTEVFTTLPAKFRKKSRSAWSDPNRHNAEVECFLEGPAFDREGNLWICDIPFGRIFRITPKGDWDLYSFAVPGSPWNSSHGRPGCSQEDLVRVGGAGLLCCFAAE